MFPLRNILEYDFDHDDDDVVVDYDDFDDSD